jgi:hypothetical protein
MAQAAHNQLVVKAVRTGERPRLLSVAIITTVRHVLEYVINLFLRSGQARNRVYIYDGVGRTLLCTGRTCPRLTLSCAWSQESAASLCAA